MGSRMTDPDRSADFGGRMKRLREARGVSLRLMADNTKIPLATLEALERNDIGRLPGGIFSRAIVRAYAEEVGTDPDTGVRDFVLQFPHESVAAGNTASSRESFGAGASGSGRRAVIVMVIVVPLAVILAWTIFALR